MSTASIPPVHLAIRELACSRGDRLLLCGFDLAAAPGETVLLTGANGTGKTTLLRLIAGLAEPDAGRVTWTGGAVSTDGHYLDHRDAMKGAFTVAGNLEHWRALQGGGGMSPKEALAALGLSALAELPARHLSAGQARRLGLARLLLTPRAVWLLDEPTTALDTAAKRAVLGMLTQHIAGGGLALIATHEPDLFADPDLNVRTVELSRPATRAV